MPTRMNRREFIKAVGSVGVMTVVVGGLEACQSVAPTSTVAPNAAAATTAATATTAPTKAPTTAATAAPTAAPTAVPAAVQSDVYVFFTQPEAKFIEAAVARIIPKDDLGDGALEAGASYFIDHQLTGGYGYNDRHYNMGPWLPPTPTQGYQQRFDPRQIYRIGIKEANDYAVATYQKTFDQISTSQQDEMLTDLAAGNAKFTTISSALFFSTLRGDTMDGFFSDPVYGGNRNKVGWLLIGYPGVPSGYKDAITKYGEKWTGPTQSMADALGM